MRPRRSFATTSLAGSIVALMLVTGVAPSWSPIGRDLAHSYRSAVRAYDRAHTWAVIARWWLDPEYVPPAREMQQFLKSEEVCQVHPGEGRESKTGVNDLGSAAKKFHPSVVRMDIRREDNGWKPQLLRYSLEQSPFRMPAEKRTPLQWNPHALNQIRGGSSPGHVVAAGRFMGDTGLDCRGHGGSDI
jgi:hypothetical protein